MYGLGEGFAVGSARYIGRVGALAVALGVGMAVAAFPTVAFADNDTEQSDSAPAPTEPAQEETAPNAIEATPSNQSDPLSDPTDPTAPPTMNIGASGGANTTIGEETEPTEEVDAEATEPESVETGPTPVLSVPDPTPPPPAEKEAKSQNTVVTPTPAPPAPTLEPPSAASHDYSRAARQPQAAQPQSALSVTAAQVDATDPEPDAADIDEAAVETEDVAPEPVPTDPFTAVATAFFDLASSFVAAWLTPFFGSGSDSPAEAPLLWTVLAFVRREFERSFFNKSPIANDDELTTTVGTVATGDVLANDVDADGDPLRASLVSGPAHGAVTLNADGSYTYTPESGYTGTDSFTYAVTDGADSWHVHGWDSFLRPNGGHTSTATVTITVAPAEPEEPAENIAPTGYADVVKTTPGTPLMTSAASLLANDVDRDGGPSPLTITAVADPYSGSVEIDSETGNLIYTPAEGFEGQDFFTYTISDGEADSDPISVLVAVTEPSGNIAPIATDETWTTQQDTPLPLNQSMLTGDDHDPDNAPIPVLSSFLVTPPAHGTFVVDYENLRLLYQPDAGFVGTDTFTYQAFDGENLSNIATVTIEVTEKTPNTPTAWMDVVKAPANSSTVISKEALLANDFDPDTDQSDLTVEILRQPPFGTTVLDPSTGAITYTPTPGFTGLDGFVYRVFDGTTYSAATAVVVVVGDRDNVAPTANDDTLTTEVDAPVFVDFPSGLTDNDTDPTFDPLVPFVVDHPSHGRLTTDPLAPRWIYTPDPGFTGTDTFTYRAFDGSDVSNVATVTINVVDGAVV